jgi:hypothetical protein
MQARNNTRAHLSIIALSALLTSGCASVTSSQPPTAALNSASTGTPLAPGSTSRAAALPQSAADTSLATLFVSTDTAYVITMWQKKDVRRPVGKIRATAPLGIVFDRSGNLFVSQGGNEGWIFTYPPPYKKAKGSVYTKHIPYFPTQLGFGPDGALYAADIDGNVYAFANGSKTPTLTIPLPTDGYGPSSGQGFAFDSQGNVFISYQSYFNDANDVLKCPPQSAKCMRMNLQLVGSEATCGNIVFDAKDNLVLAEADVPYLTVYKPDPSSPTGYSSSPSRQIFINGAQWPSELAFNIAKSRLYVGDDGAQNVFELSWPSAKTVRTFFVASPVYSIALWPGAPQ